MEISNKLNEYIIWKRQKILDVLNKKIDEFNYSYLINKEELYKYFNYEINENILKEFENNLELLEDKIFLKKENGEFILVDEFLIDLKDETIDELEKYKDSLKNYIKKNEKYIDLKYNESIIKEIIFNEKLELNNKKIVDIYGFLINGDYILDKENKIIRRGNNEKV